MPKQYEPVDPKQPWAGIKFTKSELLEFSFVSVPANAGCLIVGRSLLSAADMPLPSRGRSSGNEPAQLAGTAASQNAAAIARRIIEARDIAAKARSIAASITDDAAPTRDERLAEAQKFRRMAFGGGS
jgi:hypothetical protein